MSTLGKHIARWLLATWVALPLALPAQDYTMGNYNLCPFGLNPAMAGNANAIRLGASYHQQWLNLGNRYHTARISYDQNFYKQMCSLGFSYTYDNMADGIFQTNELALVYAHNIRLHEGYYIRLGVQASCFLNYFGYSNLVFEDQYNSYNNTINPISLEKLENDSRYFPDFSVGAAFVIDNCFSFGFSANHLGEPENGFVAKKQNRLYRKYVAHASYYYDFHRQGGLYQTRGLSSLYLFFNSNYQHQYQSNSGYLGGGVYFRPITLGVSYKTDFIDSHIAAFTAGVHLYELQIFYVVDFNLSGRGNGTWSQELALIYLIHPKKKDLCPIVLW